MADDNIISFEEYRRKLRGVDYGEGPIAELFKKDLRDQQDLVDWYRFHHTFNRPFRRHHPARQPDLRGLRRVPAEGLVDDRDLLERGDSLNAATISS